MVAMPAAVAAAVAAAPAPLPSASACRTVAAPRDAASMTAASAGPYMTGDTAAMVAGENGNTANVGMGVINAGSKRRMT